jgi:hypothetical protein
VPGLIALASLLHTPGVVKVHVLTDGCAVPAGTAFPVSERERLGLRGLLPPRITDMQLQVTLQPKQLRTCLPGAAAASQCCL